MTIPPPPPPSGWENKRPPVDRPWTDENPGWPAHSSGPSTGNWDPPGRHETGPQKRRKSMWLWLLIGVLALAGLIVAFASMGNGKKSTVDPKVSKSVAVSAKASAAKASAALKTTVGNGTWTAGEDIKAGTYKATADAGDNCAVLTSDQNGKALNGATGPGRPKFTVKDKERVTVAACPSFARQE